VKTQAAGFLVEIEPCKYSDGHMIYIRAEGLILHAEHVIAGEDAALKMATARAERLSKRLPVKEAGD
jgi:hypothetical protein